MKKQVTDSLQLSSMRRATPTSVCVVDPLKKKARKYALMLFIEAIGEALSCRFSSPASLEIFVLQDSFALNIFQPKILFLDLVEGFKSGQ